MKSRITVLRAVLFCFWLACQCDHLFSQSYLFGEGTVNWDLRKTFVLPPEANQYASSDLVILSDRTEFYFYSVNSEKIVRNVKFKINTQKGLEDLKRFEMPESFDRAFDQELHKQGRRARIKIPDIKDFSVKLFAARKFSHERWSNVTVKDYYETLRWIKPLGEFSDEDMLVFHLGTMSVGDVVEIYYEVTFNARYGGNIFYFNDKYPKLKCEYDFIYRVEKPVSEISYMMPFNISAVNTSTSAVDYGNYLLVTEKIQLADLKANLYPLNSFESRRLPHVCLDFRFYRTLVKYVDNSYFFVKGPKSKSFDWMVTLDTSVGNQTKIYDKQFGSIRKFLATLPPTGSDSQNVVFFRALCDTFNSFRYISPNHLFYNESALYELYSGDHVLRRRLPGHTAWKLYTDILKDSKLFYYLVNIQDKRLGEHEAAYRAHHAYEHNLIALPMGNSYIYFIPRAEGLKYHLNELPFYYEGVLAALTPMNFQPGADFSNVKAFKIIKTHHGTFNENTRTENAMVKISLDSMVARLTIKESLSGQYSTLLRHLYLGENIDSTVSPHYFKKCTDKPGAGAPKIKLTSKITEFPYRYNFNCVEKMGLGKDTFHVSLKNWFSFTISKELIPQAPNYDYFFDFDQSDSYNFQLDFDRPVEIKNAEAFVKKIDNDYFSLNSEIVKNAGNSYLLKAAVVIKQTSIPATQAGMLIELAEQLDQLNSFTLNLAKG